MRKNHMKTDENKLVERNSHLNLSKKLSKNCGGFEKLKLDDFFSFRMALTQSEPLYLRFKKISPNL